MATDFDGLFDSLMNSDEINDLMKQVKWALILGTISDKELQEQQGVDGEKVRPFYEFFRVFQKHDVDPEIVMEAFSKLFPNDTKQPNNDISKDELTGFVSVLDKLRKKNEEEV